MSKIKRAQFEVTAASEMGIQLGVNLAIQNIERGRLQGEDALPRHETFVRWRVSDEVVPDEIAGSLFPVIDNSSIPQAPQTGVPDISKMDIEDAKGVIATAGTREELALMIQMEESSERSPGGRASVLEYAKKHWDEIEGREAKAEEVKEADKRFDDLKEQARKVREGSQPQPDPVTPPNPDDVGEPMTETPKVDKKSSKPKGKK